MRTFDNIGKKKETVSECNQQSSKPNRKDRTYASFHFPLYHLGLSEHAWKGVRCKLCGVYERSKVVTVTEYYYIKLLTANITSLDVL